MTEPTRPIAIPTAAWPRRFAGGIGRALANAARRAGDLALPPRCLGCGSILADHQALCGTCWSDVRFIRQPVCDRLGLPLPFDLGEPTVSAAAIAAPPDYDRARAAAHFDGAARRLLHQFKYTDRLEVRVLLGRWLAETGAALLADADIIAPVPLHRRRLLWRRYNQSAILALEVAGRTGIAYAPQLIERTRRTRAQVGLSEEQRRLNVRGAFRVAADQLDGVRGRNVVLVDDVITTGATVNACARALKRAGAARVDVLAVAMVTQASAARN